MKSKQLTILLLCLGLILLVLIINIYSDYIWKDTNAEKNTEEEINIWTIHGDTEEALKRVVKKYEEMYPNIVFKITVYKNEVYQTAINNALMTDNLPDMFFWWGFSKLQRFTDMGIIYDLTDEFKKRQMDSEIIENRMKAFTFDNRVYALPLYGWTAALFCNREIFKKNKLSYPTDYNQFLNTLRTLQDNKEVPMIVGAKEGWLSSLYYMSLVQGEDTGKNIYDAVENNSLFLTSQFKDAANKLCYLVNHKVWQSDYLESDAYNASYIFSQGEGAMLYYGSWATTLLEGDSSLVKGKVDVIPFPNGNESEGIGGFVDTFVINKGGVIPKYDFLVNMYFDIMHEISDIIVNETGGGIPVYRNQKIDMERFPLLYECWKISKDRTLYPAYDQIMSEELSAQYYYLLNELMAGEINQDEFVNGLVIK